MYLTRLHCVDVLTIDNTQTILVLTSSIPTQHDIHHIHSIQHKLKLVLLPNRIAYRSLQSLTNVLHSEIIIVLTSITLSVSQTIYSTLNWPSSWKWHQIALGQEIQLTSSMKLKSLSSGFALGAVNWLFSSTEASLFYLNETTINENPSATFSRGFHKPSTTHKLSIVVAPGCIRHTEADDPTRAIGKLSNLVTSEYRQMRSVVLPMNPAGLFYDLVEFLITSLPQQVPIYILSPVGYRALSLIYLASDYLSPNFEERIVNGRAAISFKACVSAGRITLLTKEGHCPALKHPCVAIVDPHSQEFWNNVMSEFQSVEGTGMFVDIWLEDADYYKDMQGIASVTNPIDARMTALQIRSLIQQIENVSFIFAETSVADELTTYTEGIEVVVLEEQKMVEIPFESGYSIGWVDIRSFPRYVLEESGQRMYKVDISLGKDEEGALVISPNRTKTERASILAKDQVIPFGHLSVMKLVSNLKSQGVRGILVTFDDSNRCVVEISCLDAFVSIYHGNVEIECNNEHFRTLINSSILKAFI